VLERGEGDDWFASTTIIVTSAIAAFCLPMFVWWELRVKSPIINVRLFKESVVFNGVMLMGLLGFFLYGVVFVLPIFVDRTYHYDATQTGLLFIPGSLLTAAIMPFVGAQLQAGRNPKILIAIGLLSLEACLFLMTKFSPLTSHGELIRMLFVRGFGMAFLFVPINSSILSQFRGIELGQVSGLLNLFRQIGGSIGIAMIATLLTTRSRQNYLDLSSKVSLLNTNTQSAYYAGVHGMGSKMSGMVGMSANGNAAALKSLYYRIQGQVFMMSFIQLMFTVMIIFAFSFVPLALLKFKVKPKGVIAGH
jgi:DHA2 family multidrug resistance protein